MVIWKMIAYPFGLAILGMTLVDLVGVILFGGDCHSWQEWQNQMISTAGIASGLTGAVGGVYLAIRSHARLMH